MINENKEQQTSSRRKYQQYVNRTTFVFYVNCKELQQIIKIKKNDSVDKINVSNETTHGVLESRCMWVTYTHSRAGYDVPMERVWKDESNHTKYSKPPSNDLRIFSEIRRRNFNMTRSILFITCCCLCLQWVVVVRYGGLWEQTIWLPVRLQTNTLHG